jgi:hypothetical protein
MTNNGDGGRAAHGGCAAVALAIGAVAGAAQLSSASVCLGLLLRQGPSPVVLLATVPLGALLGVWAAARITRIRTSGAVWAARVLGVLLGFPAGWCGLMAFSFGPPSVGVPMLGFYVAVTWGGMWLCFRALRDPTQG